MAKLQEAVSFHTQEELERVHTWGVVLREQALIDESVQWTEEDNELLGELYKRVKAFNS